MYSNNRHWSLGQILSPFIHAHVYCALLQTFFYILRRNCWPYLVAEFCSGEYGAMQFWGIRVSLLALSTYTPLKFCASRKNKFPVKVIHLRDFLNTSAGMPYEGVWALPQLIDNNNKNILETLSGISPPEQKEWTSHASGETRENGGTKLTTL